MNKVLTILLKVFGVVITLLVMIFFGLILYFSVEYCNNYTVTARDIFFIALSLYAIWWGLNIIIDELKPYFTKLNKGKTNE